MSVANKPEMVSFSIKGEIVIPRRLRKEFEIVEGTKATVVSTPEGILLKLITSKFIKSLRGSMKSTKAMEVFTTERRRERDL